MSDSTDAALLDAPAFEPVPTKVRHDGWTPERQRRFVAALATLGSVAQACRAVGISSTAAYKLRGRADAKSFAAAWDTALAIGRDRVWDRALDRALNGYTRPTRYRGKVTGTRHAFDNRLAFAIAYGGPAADPFPALTRTVSHAPSSASRNPE